MVSSTPSAATTGRWWKRAPRCTTPPRTAGHPSTIWTCVDETQVSGPLSGSRGEMSFQSVYATVRKLRNVQSDVCKYWSFLTAACDDGDSEALERCWGVNIFKCFNFKTVWSIQIFVAHFRRLSFSNLSPGARKIIFFGPKSCWFLWYLLNLLHLNWNLSRTFLITRTQRRSADCFDKFAD